MIGKLSNELVFSEAYAFHEYVLYSEHIVLHNTLKHSLMPLALHVEGKITIKSLKPKWTCVHNKRGA